MPTRDVPLAPDARTAGEPRLRGWLLLGALLGSPLAWVVHLNGAYVIVALWCAERWPGTGIAVGVLTALCVAACAASGLLAVRLWRTGQRLLATDEEPGEPGSWDARMGERGARGVFLAVVALFMAALFGYLVLLQGLPPVFAPHCKPGLGP
ncbi:MAG TPA: hypothetical protein VEA99_20525 [Gemmatimonadaceae bacterium]|nr:hypothetical protein [Gemmatimonadaceae bacterium]